MISVLNISFPFLMRLVIVRYVRVMIDDCEKCDTAYVKCSVLVCAIDTMTILLPGIDHTFIQIFMPMITCHASLL